MTPTSSERGAALLTVLLLVAVMGALAAVAMDRLRLATALAGNAGALDQGRAFAIGVEELALLQITDLSERSSDRTTLAGGWNGAARTIPLPDGSGAATAIVRDGGNCFNLNSLVQGAPPEALAVRPAGVTQFANLMAVLGIPPGPAQSIAAASADWIDSDDASTQGGAEDSVYAGMARPYRTAGTLLSDPSELRAVAGVTPEIYARLRPWICALPITELSPINVNTLLPEQAPLLAMLEPGQISLDTAARAIASRPVDGWANPGEFFTGTGLADVQLASGVEDQPQVRTVWFEVGLDVAVRGATMREQALVDARILPARIASRNWGEPA